jgi:Cyclic-phosphate processing Receiver domain
MVSAGRCEVKVWLDDRRSPPDASWTWVKTPAEAINLLKCGRVIEASFDHDLALFDEVGRETTGMAVLEWIEREVVLNGFDPPKLAAHSSNPPARARMEQAIEAIRRRAGH